MSNTSTATALPSWTALMEPSTMIGTPDADAQWWPGQPTVPNSCGIESSQYILEQFTHSPIDEQTLANEAEQHQWFDPNNGMNVYQIQDLLQANGVPTEVTASNITTLETQLAEGHKVIAFVDASALDPGAPSDGGQPDHFVVVDGIDDSDPNNPQVIISDPYTGDAEDQHSLDQFLQAWIASGDTMVSTAIAPSDALPSGQPDLAYPQDMSPFTWTPAPATPESAWSDPLTVAGTGHAGLGDPSVDPTAEAHTLF